MARLDAQRLAFPVREVLAHGATWIEAHQGLRILVAGDSKYEDAAFVEKVVDSLRPRTVLAHEDLHSTIRRSLDENAIEHLRRFQEVKGEWTFPPELVLVFGSGDAADDLASLARERQIEVIRPVKEQP